MADSAIDQKTSWRKTPLAPRTGKMVSCDICGRSHYRKGYTLKHPPKGGTFYCSRVCRHAEIKRVDLVCDTCGVNYNRFRSQSKRGGKTFCSRSCQSKFGLSSVACCWPGCIKMVPCRFTLGSGRNGVDEYKVNLVKKGHYTRYAFCPHHAATVKKYLGEKSRFTGGRSQMLSDPDREYGGRALSARFTRMVVFEQADCKCQSCSKRLDWNAPPKVWEVDHIIPLFKGGKTKLANLQILCFACHDEKSAGEKSEASRERHRRTKANRWFTHHQKDLLIERLRSRLLALGEPID